MSIKEEFNNIIKKDYKNMSFSKPLFYNWDTGIRFNLQIESNHEEEYFKENLHRSTEIFKYLFSDNDDVLICIRQFRHKNRSRIHKNCFLLKQMNIEKNEKICFTKIISPYDKTERFNQILLNKKVAQINISNIFKAIANTDFPSRKPQLAKGRLGFEIYFINKKNSIALHMYDDRGMDVISPNIEDMDSLYKEKNCWILDYDREKIDKLFKKNQPTAVPV